MCPQSQTVPPYCRCDRAGTIKQLQPLYSEGAWLVRGFEQPMTEGRSRKGETLTASGSSGNHTPGFVPPFSIASANAAVHNPTDSWQSQRCGVDSAPGKGVRFILESEQPWVP